VPPLKDNAARCRRWLTTTPRSRFPISRTAATRACPYEQALVAAIHARDTAVEADRAAAFAEGEANRGWRQAAADLETVNKTAADLEAVFDVPVQVSAVLGRSRMDVADLLKLGPGTVLELDRKVGEAIDIYVNNRLVARGEVVLVEDKLGVTMTEIIKAER